MQEAVAQPAAPKSQPSSPNLLDILRRRWWIIALLMVGAVGVVLIGALLAPPTYRSTMRLQVFVLDEQEVTLFSRLSSPDAAEQIAVTQAQFVEVLQSQLIAWRTINELGLDMNADQLLDNLETRISGDFVTVSYDADSAQEAQDILTAHVNNGVSHFESLRAQPVKATGQFVQAELSEQSQTVTAARERLLRFQLEHNVGDLIREINAVQDVLRNLELARDAAQVEAERNEALAVVWHQFADEAEAEATQARDQLAEVQANAESLGDALSQAQAGQLVRLEDEVAAQEALARNYRTTALNQDAAAASQRAAVREQDAVVNQRRVDLAQLIGLSSEFDNLVAAVDSAQADYDFLRNKAVEARLKERQISDVGYLQVVENAFLPTAPVASPVLRLVLLAAVVSLLFGVVVVLLLELVSPTLPATGR